MKFAKLFKFFKKGAKAAAKRKGKKGAEPVRWPSGTRIGVFGHANSGKTVYFTVLNEDCKIARRLQISVTDTATAGEFLTNYRNIWGLGTASDAGTVVDFKGERKFPEQTENDKILKFNAIVDKKKLSVVTYDYPGEAVSISSSSDLNETVIDFMAGCDGILFFYDPKILGAELESQARVASFVNLLEILAPIRTRLPIPMAVVVTKADILPGFSGDEHVRLIGPEDEYLTSEDFDVFLERVLAKPIIAKNANWAGSVRNVLVKLKDFLQVVLRRTLDFQMFFVSCTGTEPEKIGTDVGRSIYTPPPKMQPVGVKEPFRWVLNSIVRNKRISRIRKISKYAAILSLIWIILFSIPYLYHFKLLFPKPIGAEQRVAEAHNGRLENANKDEKNDLIKAYNRYANSSIVKMFFDDYGWVAGRIADQYRGDAYQGALKELKTHIDRFAKIVADTGYWPKVKPADGSLELNDEHGQLAAAFAQYQTWDSSSTLFEISDRMMGYWNLFLEGVKQPKDSATWAKIQAQIKYDRDLFGAGLSTEEKQLADAFMDIKVKVEQAKKAEQATVQLDDLIATINGNPSPEYRLDDAVDTLRKIRGDVDRKNKRKINAYIESAERWYEPREYSFTFDKIPADWHLHIAVAERNQDPEWKKEGYYVVNRKEKIVWKAGDVIHVALDSLHPGGETSWGANPRAKRTLDSKFSIFDMEGELAFPDAGQSVIIRFDPILKDQLPELE